MDSDDAKLFIGGIAWDTTEDTLREYFGQYGEVNHAVIMRDKTTGQPRGFGFVVFSDASVLDAVLQDKHSIDGRMVEAKRALSREQQQNVRSGNPNAGRSFAGEGNVRTKKIFVGGLPSTLTEEEFGQYFQNYGNVADVVIMFDQNTSRPRGFGFITFDSEDAVDRVLHKNFHELKNKLVEVKRAFPKEANPGGSARSGGYGGYSGANARAFDNRTENNRFLQPQPTVGGYPPYPNYGAPSYGYGMPAGSVGYSGYGSYGVSGYGGANPGFAGPAGAYGNPNAPTTGYMSASPGAMKNQWSNQTPGYGASGYNINAGQSPTDGSRHGNQGYGYSSYGGSEGSYGDPAGYGSAKVGPNSNSGNGTSEAGHHGSGSGYAGRSYGSSNGSSAYSEAAWRADS